MMRFLIVLLSLSLFAQDHLVSRILHLNISSTINPATLNYLETQIKKAPLENTQLILIQMNTPGGLVSTTKDILKVMGESPIPVAIWIGPEGASATSAGAIISSGAHILTMARGTNIGAATPIALQGKHTGKDLRKKAVNDLEALVRGLSQARGRNPVPFTNMISKASSYTAFEAKKKKAIDAVMNSLQEFPQIINGKTINVKGKKLRLKFAPGVQFVEKGMDFGQSILNIFADPSLTYILFLIGAALIYFEFQAPGGFIAGGLGVLCILLSGIGLQVLPLNFGSLGLIILAFFLFILEMYVPSFGFLTLLGFTSFTMGSLFLFRTEHGSVHLPKEPIISALLALASFLIFITFFWAKDSKSKDLINTQDHHSLIGKKGVIISITPHPDSYTYQVKIHGEIWNATGQTEYKIGDEVKVLKYSNNELTLII